MDSRDLAAISFIGWVGAGVAVDCVLARRGLPWSSWIRGDWTPAAKAALAVTGIYLVAHVCVRLPADPLTAVGRLIVRGV